MRHRASLLRALLILATSACASPSASGQSCAIERPSTPLPEGLEETSGIAASRRNPGVYWSHNDSGGELLLIGVTDAAERVAEVRLTGARNRDWEDVAVGPCDGESCVFVADIGDNSGKRGEIQIYRFPEPERGRRGAVQVERFRARYPGGARDAEALFVLPDGAPYIVTKGRNSPVSVYRYPLPMRAGEVVELERVADLSIGRRTMPDLVTGAGASPSGEWVGIRTYNALSIHRARDLVAGRTEPARVYDLSPVREMQGEAVALLDDGRVVLTSEGGGKKAPGTLAVLRCPLREP